jgi:hypothetical protein
MTSDNEDSNNGNSEEQKEEESKFISKGYNDAEKIRRKRKSL